MAKLKEYDVCLGFPAHCFVNSTWIRVKAVSVKAAAKKGIETGPGSLILPVAQPFTYARPITAYATPVNE